MIIEVKSTQELKQKITDFAPRFLHLTNSEGNTFCVWNRSLDGIKAKIDEIIKILSNPNTPDDVYFIEARMSRQKPNIIYKFIKGTPTQAAQDPPVFLAAPAPIQEAAQDILSNKDLLELRVENERLKMENERLQDIIDQYEDEAATLDDAPPPPAGNAWKELVESLMPALDAVVGTWNKSIETKQAALAMQYQAAQIQPPPPPVTKAPETLTYEELEAARVGAPQAFYTWLSEPGNQEYYNNLKAAQNGL